MGKRTEIRQKRAAQQRKKRLLIFAIIVVCAVVVAGIFIVPSLKSIGEIVEPTPVARPQAIDNFMGDPNALVKVQEFADFQCPACKRFAQNYESQIIRDYVATGKVYYEFTPFSFIGQESIDGAEAAYCAMDQGKFWEYHDMLYANQTGENIGDFTIDRLKAFAEKLGLDKGAFDTCLETGKYQAKVTNDKTEGVSLGVNATPSFAVNGKVVYSDKLILSIQEALTAQSAK